MTGDLSVTILYIPIVFLIGPKRLKLKRVCPRNILRTSRKVNYNINMVWGLNNTMLKNTYGKEGFLWPICQSSVKMFPDTVRFSSGVPPSKGIPSIPQISKIYWTNCISKKLDLSITPNYPTLFFPIDIKKNNHGQSLFVPILFRSFHDSERWTWGLA